MRALLQAATVSAAALLLPLMACASVRPIPAPAADPELPAMRTLESEGAAAGGVDASDFKLREAPRPRIRLALFQAGGGGGLSAPMQDIAYLKMVRLLGFPDVDLVNPPADIARSLGTPQAQNREFLAKNEIDAIAAVNVKRTGENGAKVALRLIDPVSGTDFGEFVQSARIVDYTIDPKHQAEFFKDRRSKRVEFLEPRQSPGLEFSGDGRASVRELVMKSVTAEYSIQSSSPETEVVLIDASTRQRESLGTVPISGKRLREGSHRLEFKRPGYDAIARDIQVRAGREREIFVTWPDDQGNTSLSVLSMPAGQRVSLDGTVRGVTPLFLTSVDPGAYGVELSRTTQGNAGVYEVTGDSTIELAGGDNARRIFFTNYTEVFDADLLSGDRADLWQINAEDEGVLPEYAGQGGLAFRLGSGSKTPAAGESRLGLVSHPFIANGFEIELQYVQGADTQFSFGLVNAAKETVLIRVSGKQYTLERFVEGQPVVPLSFETVRQREGNVYPLRFVYEPEENRLIVSIDGDTVYEGPFNSGPAARIALWADAASADGRVLARSLRIRSGRGLYDD